MILRSRWALKFLLKLDVAKAAGPELLPARILKEVAKQIYMPLIVLCRRILIEGHWPASWRLHRLCPIYKQNSVYDANFTEEFISRASCPKSLNASLVVRWCVILKLPIAMVSISGPIESIAVAVTSSLCSCVHGCSVFAKETALVHS